MKTTEKTWKIELVDGLSATVVLRRDGQQPPEKGDRVVVVAELRLPSDANQHLAGPIRFGSRVILFGEDLHPGWGSEKQTYRVRTWEFIAGTWAEAFERAHEYAEGQMQSLLTALEQRQQALVDAEK